MSRSPLTEVIRRVEGMISYVQQNLNADEYSLFLDLLVPEPEPEQVEAKTKRGRKKGTKGASKRASSIAAQLTKSPESKLSDDGACAFVLENGQTCNTGDNNPIHDKSFGYSGYHEFKAAA